MGRDTTPTYRTFTIKWDEVSNPANFFVGYYDDAAGLTQGSSDFDNFFGYSGVKLSTAWVETAQLNLNSMSTETWLTGWDNIMVKFPCRGIKMSKSWSQVTLSITDEPNKSGYQYYAFTRWSTIKDKFYMGCYLWTFVTNGGNVSASGINLRSWATGTYTTNASPAWWQTMATFRTRAENNWTGYDLMTWYQWNYINALYMMKYGNPRNQNIVGMWLSGWSWVEWPWATNSVNAATWATTTADTWRIKLFWLEDRWGNAYSWVEWAYYNSSTQLTVSKTNDDFHDWTYTNNLGRVYWGYMKQISGTNDTMFMSAEWDLSLTTGDQYYTDNFWVSTSWARPLCCWGYYNWWVGNWAFRISHTASNAAQPYLCGRLMYL